MRKYSLLVVFLYATLTGLSGQAPASTEHEAGPIQDNSFLLEEAYNQEPGVIQHISTFTRLWNSNQWAYTFTQEWPVPAHWQHQLSLTLTQAKNDPAMKAGFGDVLFNYRYQIIGSGETRIAAAPRYSLILPTGSWRNGAGYGGVGMQANLPASIVLSRNFVSHSNLGGTWVPVAHGSSGGTAPSYGYNAGQSIIWLARPSFNVLFESAWSSSHLVTGPAATHTQDALWLVPGVRWAHDFKSGLQIVPGIAFVGGAGPSQGQHGLFLYLSFEHPLWKDGSRGR